MTQDNTQIPDADDNISGNNDAELETKKTPEQMIADADKGDWKQTLHLVIDILIIIFFIVFVCFIAYAVVNIQAINAFDNPCAYAINTCKQYSCVALNI